MRRLSLKGKNMLNEACDRQRNTFIEIPSGTNGENYNLHDSIMSDFTSVRMKVVSRRYV